MPRSLLTQPILLLAALLLVACSSEKPPAPTAGAPSAGGGVAAPKPEAPAPSAGEQTAPAGKAVDPATAATVKGVVNFNGTPPDRATIAMAADASCAAMHKSPVLTDALLVEGGRVANVFVYVKEGAEGLGSAAPVEPAVLDQKGCVYVPRVVGLVVGQKLRVLNSDPTTHNVNAQPKKSSPINQGQPSGSPEIEKSFKNPELNIRVKCDIHPWMGAVVHVLKHPYFAITSSKGEFTLPALPPGTYVLEAVHETLGAQVVSVSVGPKETKSVEFTFQPK
ncbi:MAG: hypothetical protein JNJ88_07670 [Planctomycetes bacterium]|nr:hypothetical protein [Planctomycetota bacterium]